MWFIFKFMFIIYQFIFLSVFFKFIFLARAGVDKREEFSYLNMYLVLTLHAHSDSKKLKSIYFLKVFFHSFRTENHKL